MKNIFGSYWKQMLSLLFTIVVFLFWVFPYVSVLSYQEQYQLFLFDSDYFLERIALPGGLADYLAEFLTQFNYTYAVGAAILALLFLSLQLLTWRLAKKCGAKNQWYPLSFIPAILLWFYMGDENVMLSFLISLIAAELTSLTAIYLHEKGEGLLLRITFVVLSIPLFYWLFGANVWIVAGFMILFEVFNRKSKPVYFLAPLLVIAVILLWAQFIQYPLYRLMGGLNYYRYPAYVPVMQMIVMTVVAIMPFVIGKFPDVKFKFTALAEVIVLATGGYFLVNAGFDPLKYDIIEYDFLVRINAWDKIIDKATENQPKSPMEVSCVNLALSQKGQLCDRMFEFYQNGSEGLFPAFSRDMVSPVSTGEVFFNLGMVNDAERYMYEAQEAIPNFRKSGRLTKRIIQCEIINGKYDVAEKYLHKLQKSLYYRKWANEQMTYLRNEARINGDPVYGKLRKYRVTSDYLFSDQEMDQMLGLLYSHCYENRNAFEYMMAYVLVQRDMYKFMKYYPIGQYAGYTDHIPYVFQQALLLYWTQTHGGYQGMPWSIDRQWIDEMTVFIQTYMKKKDDASLKEGTLGKTFWSYMMVNKNVAKKADKSMKQIY